MVATDERNDITRSRFSSGAFNEVWRRFCKPERALPGTGVADVQTHGAHMFASRENDMCLSCFSLGASGWRVMKSLLSFAAETKPQGAKALPAYILPEAIAIKMVPVVVAVSTIRKR